MNKTTHNLKPLKMPFLVFSVFLFAALNANAQISGKVFRDFNANGTKENSTNYNETFEAGIVVNAYSTTGTLLATQTTVATGTTSNYGFPATGTNSIASGTAVRLEFVLPSAYFPTAGSSGNTTVQFKVAGAAITADLGINRPDDYSQANPLLVVPIHASQDAATDNVNVLAKFPRSITTDIDGNTIGTVAQGPYTPQWGTVIYTPNRPDPAQAASLGQTGTTWGVAYNKYTKKLYAASYIKRGAKLGPGESTGAIWIKTDPTSNAAPTLFVDLNAVFGAGTAGANPHPVATTDWATGTWDGATLPLVGKVGLGDIELSKDGSMLYAVNLADRKLYAIPTSGPLNSTTITRYSIPTASLPVATGATTTGIAAVSDVRPFGLGFDKNGVLYVGAVCSAESVSAGANTDPNNGAYQMTAYVWKFVGGVFTMVLNEPLRFDRDNSGSYTCAESGSSTDWEPWSNVDEQGNEQPMLASIDFADDRMILGFRDRGADQNYGPNSGGGFKSSGDIYMACPQAGGTWKFEQAGGCGGLFSSRTTNREGPGGGEFFEDKQGDGINNSGNGGVFVLPGYGVLSTVTDAVIKKSDGTDLDNASAAGVQTYSMQTGNYTSGYDMYYHPSVARFSKGSGIGDLEVLTEPAPIEVGNRVWLDTDADGVQDAGENGISGVAVQLWGDLDGNGSFETQVGAATTDAQGQYRFACDATANMLPSPTTIPTNGTVNAQLGGGSDDAKQNKATGAMTLTGNLELLRNGTVNQTVGLRFPNITIPKGATITGAYLEFMPTTATSSSGSPVITIYGQAADNAATFTTTTNDISSRAKTVATASWSPAAWTNGGNPQQTGSVSNIVQEIVNRTAWASGNAMAFILDNAGSTAFRTAQSYETLNNYAPRLIMTYTYNATQTYCLDKNIKYEVRIPNASGASKQAALSTNILTVANTLDDRLDSDGIASSSMATTNFIINDYGKNDYSFDFGFRPLVSSIATTVNVSGCYDSNGNTAGGTSQATVQVIVDWEQPVAGQTITVTVPGAAATQSVNPATSTKPAILAFTVPTATATSGNVTAVYTGASGIAATPKAISIAASNCLMTPCASGNTGGQVFRDFNNNGIKDALETQGIPSVTVTAFWVSGATSGTATTATDANGQYVFVTGTAVNQIPSGAKVRLEFTNLPLGVLPTASGSNNRTTVQFITAPTCAANVGVNYPSDYCQTNPNTVAPIYINGYGSNDRIFLGGPYSSTTPPFAGGVYDGTPAATTPVALGTAAQVGAIWGIAYKHNTKDLFASAVLKRHVGLGPLGLGGIYKINTATGTVSNFLDVSALGVNVGTVGDNVARGLTTVKTDPNRDGAVFSMIGKKGIGDLDISDDDKKLYFTNLHNRRLYSVVIDADNNPVTAPTSADTASFAIPSPNCNNGVARPWGIKVRNGKVYVGVVCTGESGGTTNDLQANIYALDIATGVFNTNPVLSFPLSYPKNDVEYGAGTRWLPWSDLFSDMPQYSGDANIYPEPILSDIEFDTDGSMIIGFNDRMGHQIGYNNYQPDPADNSLYRAEIGGDLLRASYTGAGNYILENNGVVGGLTGTAINTAGGPGGGEFYDDAAVDVHHDALQGGIALLPGKGQVIGTFMDPLRYWSGGVSTWNNANGTRVNNYELYWGNDVSVFGKSNGVGDLEIMCNTSPLEIGNYVWNDANANGIQDPSEVGFPNVKVQLFSRTGVLVGLTTTNTAGEYYFNTNNVDTLGVNTTTGAASATGFTGMSYNTPYYIVVGNGGTNPFSTATATLNVGAAVYNLTTANTGQGSFPDLNDNDAVVAASISAAFNGFPYIRAVTGSAGSSDHSFDFGFKCIPPVPSITGSTITCNSGTTALTASASGATAFIWSNAATTATVNVNAGTYTVTISNAAACSATASAVVTNTNSPTGVTASPTNTTCYGGVSQNNAKITLTGFSAGVRYQYSAGSTFSTGTPSTITAIPAGGVIATTLSNPTAATQVYTVRLYHPSNDTCFTDINVTISKVDCTCPSGNCGAVNLIKN